MLAAVEDYRWPQGTVFLDRAAYRDLWKDPLLSDLEIRFRPGAAQADVRRRLARLTAERGSCPVYDAKDLKRLSGAVLDRTLRFTHVQVAVAVLIGFMGIVNTLFISVLRRRREIGLLRAMGMSRGQAARMVVLESVLLALLGGALGTVLGLAAAGGPLSDYVLEISGYRVPLVVPWGTVLGALGAAALTGVLAGYLPARHAARLNVLEAISYE